jgi:hypothetical protein
VNKGGRTAMHVIAKRDTTFLGIINCVFPDEASLNSIDPLLQWVPLQCAVRSEKWFIVEGFLESNVDRSGLGVIRQRTQDPDYIDPIIIQAVTYGHLLFLEFLYSIGVNIHQASSRDFPFFTYRYTGTATENCKGDVERLIETVQYLKERVYRVQQCVAEY